MKYALALLVVIVIALHQDFWNWTDKSLVLGILPVGLAYHGLYALVAAGTMALLVRFLWPRELDEDPDGGAGVPVAPAPVTAGAGEASR